MEIGKTELRMLWRGDFPKEAPWDDDGGGGGDGSGKNHQKSNG
jgi:hypothetical protein